MSNRKWLLSSGNAVKAKPLSTIALLSLLVCIQPAQAASPADQGSETSPPDSSWRKTPPVLPAPKSFKLPHIEEYKLPNGLKIKLVEDHRVPFLTAAIGIKSGTTIEPDDKHGLAAMTADMLTEGTKNLTSKQFAEEVEFLGGKVGVNASHDFTIASTSGLSQYKDKLFSLFAEAVLNPAFNEKELDLAKNNALEALKIERSKPGKLADERFSSVVFGKHPYAVVFPKPEHIESISRQDLVDFHKQHYLPNISTMVVIGDFQAGEIKPLIAKYFGNWKPGNLASADFSEPPKHTGKRIYLVNRPGSVQSSIKLGNLGLERTSPDYYAFVVTNQVLGGSGGSRLFMNLRENKSYTYGAYSSTGSCVDRASVAARTDVRNDVTGHAIQEMLYELGRIRNIRTSDKELSDAKSYLIGNFQLGLETQSGLAQKILEGTLFNLPDNYLETYSNQIAAVDAERIRAVARKYLDLDNLVITVVGDAQKIKQDLQFIAPVSVYDTDGKEQAAGLPVDKSGS